MKLTEERKRIIDAKSYEELLSAWRFGTVAMGWFQDETGEYWSKRMAEMRDKHPNPAQVSKDIGWDR